MILGIEFWASFAIGFVIVVGASWDRFDEPTWRLRDGESRVAYYKKFKPSFIALRQKYNLARYAYVFLFAFAFLMASLVPELGNELLALAQGNEVESEGTLSATSSFAYPMAIAALLMSVQSVPYLKLAEERARRLLHKWAKAPEGAANTVERLKRSPFTFDAYTSLDDFRNQVGEFREVQSSDTYGYSSDNSQQNPSDPILYDWAKISCIFYYLRKSETDAFGEFDREYFEARFFEEYREEYDEIRTLRGNLEIAVKDYRGAIQYPARPATLADTLRKDLDKLLERLYSFVACAVRCKQATESNVVSGLNKFGFQLAKPTPGRIDIGSLVGLFLGLCLVWPAVQFLAPQIFERWAFQDLAQLPPMDLKAAFPHVPIHPIDSVRWLVSIVMLHAISLFLGLAFRAHKIRSDSWYNVHSFSRPHSLYFLTSLIGFIAGYIVLMILGVAFVLLDPSVVAGHDFYAKVKLLAWTNLIWAILPAVSVWFAVYHYDSTVHEKPKYIAALWSLGQGLLTAAIALGLALLYTAIVSSQDIPPERASVAPNTAELIDLVFALFIAGIFFYVGSFLGYLFQRRRLWLFINSFMGNWKVDSHENSNRYLRLGPKRRASLSDHSETNPKTGEWLLPDNSETSSNSRISILWKDGDPWIMEINTDGENTARFLTSHTVDDQPASEFFGKRVIDTSSA